MPVLLAPLVVIGAALLSIVALMIYERMFGSPLQGLANSVPVVGGYIARGVTAAVDYGKRIFAQYVTGTVEHTVKWLDGLRRSVQGFVEGVNDYLVALPGHLDHLLHVSVHDIVKAFVNPVRTTANEALGDAAAAAHGLDVLSRDVTTRLHGIEGDVKGEIDRATDVIRNVDLPDFLHAAERFAQHAADGVAGDLSATRDWAGGWIDYLLDQLQQIPLEDLLAAAGTIAGTAAIVAAIESEAGLGNPGCRAKVKQICATDPRAWEQLLGLAVATFAFPGLRALVDVAAVMLDGMHDVVRAVGES